VSIVSDPDPQPGLSTVVTNVPKSIESSMSELSISQASDALTDSSKSSTAENVEEVCSLPLESDKQEKIKEEEKDTTVVDAIPDIVATVEEPQVEIVKTEEKDEPKPESAPKVAKSQDESQIKKSDSSKSVSGKGGVPKGNKSKEVEAKPIAPIESVSVEKIPIVSAAEPEKVVRRACDRILFYRTCLEFQVVPAPVAAPAPAVFNYAAAARANLPAKSAVPAAVPSPTTPPLAKQDSVPKETPPSSASVPVASAKTQAKPAPKPSKSSKDAKDTKSSFAKGPAGAKKTNAKK
jgi:hypothetical protein